MHFDIKFQHLPYEQNVADGSFLAGVFVVGRHNARANIIEKASVNIHSERGAIGHSEKIQQVFALKRIDIGREILDAFVINFVAVDVEHCHATRLVSFGHIADTLVNRCGIGLLDGIIEVVPGGIVFDRLQIFFGTDAQQPSYKHSTLLLGCFGLLLQLSRLIEIVSAKAQEH